MFSDLNQQFLTRLLVYPCTSRLVNSGMRKIMSLPRREVCEVRFFRQHLKAASLSESASFLRLQCQFAGFLKTQEHIIFTAHSCATCAFYNVIIQSSHSFLHFLSDILPMTNEEIVALNSTYFLVFSLIDVKSANQPLD